MNLKTFLAMLHRDAHVARRNFVTLLLQTLFQPMLLVFVFGADSYRKNGISRWDAYQSPGGALEPMFFATVALMTLAAGAMIFAIVRHRRRLMRASTLGAGAVALLLGIPTVIGFSTN